VCVAFLALLVMLVSSLPSSTSATEFSG